MKQASFFLAILSGVLRATENALERSSRHSLFVRFIRSRAASVMKICRAAAIPKAAWRVLAALLEWVGQEAYRFCSRIYNGSVVMNILGRAAEHSRWIR